MDANAVIKDIDLNTLRIIQYPDPRLSKASAEIEPPFGEKVHRLADRMFELMHQAKGVGLAAPQVGLNIRLFVACPSGESDDRRIYINPRIVSGEGKFDDEEGCLSVPGIHPKIRRSSKVLLRAIDPQGQPFEEIGEGLLARIFQHETDHLDGTIIVNRMGSLARMAHRRTLQDLQERYEESQK